MEGEEVGRVRMSYKNVILWFISLNHKYQCVNKLHFRQ